MAEATYPLHMARSQFQTLNIERGVYAVLNDRSSPTLYWLVELQ